MYLLVLYEIVFFLINWTFQMNSRRYSRRRLTSKNSSILMNDRRVYLHYFILCSTIKKNMNYFGDKFSSYNFKLPPIIFRFVSAFQLTHNLYTVQIIWCTQKHSTASTIFIKSLKLNKYCMLSVLNILNIFWKTNNFLVVSRYLKVSNENTLSN